MSECTSHLRTASATRHRRWSALCVSVLCVSLSVSRRDRHAGYRLASRDTLESARPRVWRRAERQPDGRNVNSWRCMWRCQGLRVRGSTPCPEPAVQRKRPSTAVSPSSRYATESDTLFVPSQVFFFSSAQVVRTRWAVLGQCVCDLRRAAGCPTTMDTVIGCAPTTRDAPRARSASAASRGGLGLARLGHHLRLRRRERRIIERVGLDGLRRLLLAATLLAAA